MLNEIFLAVGCTPPYATSHHNISMCTEQNQMKQISNSQLNGLIGEEYGELPCRGIEKINYAVTEIDQEETAVPYFTICFNFPELSYKEIKRVRDFDVQALVGNVGGYIGLFLGYALMMIPQFLKGLGTQICHWIEIKRQNSRSK